MLDRRSIGIGSGAMWDPDRITMEATWEPKSGNPDLRITDCRLKHAQYSADHTQG
jgi:hypothetical protein